MMQASPLAHPIARPLRFLVVVLGLGIGGVVSANPYEAFVNSLADLDEISLADCVPTDPRATDIVMQCSPVSLEGVRDLASASAASCEHVMMVGELAEELPFRGCFIVPSLAPGQLQAAIEERAVANGLDMSEDEPWTYFDDEMAEFGRELFITTLLADTWVVVVTIQVFYEADIAMLGVIGGDLAKVDLSN